MSKIPDKLRDAIADLMFSLGDIEDAVYESATEGGLDTESRLEVRACILRAAHTLTNTAEDLLT